MRPWYRGFQGDIECAGKDKYKTHGKISLVENKPEVKITELPIRVWTQNYKEQLEQWIVGTEKVPAWILVCCIYMCIILLYTIESLKFY